MANIFWWPQFDCGEDFCGLNLEDLNLSDKYP